MKGEKGKTFGWESCERKKYFSKKEVFDVV
jgi:hypothetical protein